jgi:FkbM family methyltransferase
LFHDESSRSTLSLPRRLREALGWRMWYYGQQLGRGVLLRCHRFPSVFSSWEDMREYTRSVLTLGACTAPVTVRLRALGGQPVLCRPGTSDPWELWDAFCNRFQLPPSGIAPKRCIVDLGANVGYTAAFFAALYPEAQVLAVEMDRGNADIAAVNLAPFGTRCRLLHAAVWSSDGEMEYGGAEENGYRVLPSGESRSSLRGKVLSRSLDSLFAEYRLDSIDYLKMDIEGAEAEVFTASLAWAQRVRAMKIEFHKPATFESCASALARVGFRCEADNVHPHCVVAVR